MQHSEKRLSWVPVYLGKNEALIFFFLLYSQKVGRQAHTTIPNLWKNSTVLGGKDLYTFDNEKAWVSLTIKPTSNKPHLSIRSFSMSHANISGQPKIISYLKKTLWKTEAKTSKQIKGNLEKTEIVQGTQENKINHKTHKNVNILKEKLLHPLEKNRKLWKIKIK